MQKVLMLVHNDFEDDEVRLPQEALKKAGVTLDIAAPDKGKIYRGKKGRHTVTSDVALDQVMLADYDLLVLPGGYVPDHLRLLPAAIDIVREFGRRNLPIAAVCHGPQLLISADLVHGRQVTGFESIAVDLKNAGGRFVDQPLVIDGNLITSRKPADLPAFCDAILATLRGAEVKH